MTLRTQLGFAIMELVWFAFDLLSFRIKLGLWKDYISQFSFLHYLMKLMLVQHSYFYLCLVYIGSN